MTRATYLSFVIILATALALLTLLVLTGRTDSLDFLLRDILLNLDTQKLVNFWLDITFLGSVTVIVAFTLLALIILALQAKWQEAKQFIYGMGGAAIIEVGFKLVVHRARPNEIFPHTMPLSYSFPSGHALYAMMLYFLVASTLGNSLPRLAQLTLWTAVVLIVALIGASRIFLGVHYPTDVLGGYLTAGLWLVILHFHVARSKALAGF